MPRTLTRLSILLCLVLAPAAAQAEPLEVVVFDVLWDN